MSLDVLPAETGEFWLFGYGSLIWKPPPHFGEFQVGWPAMSGGFGNQDHRGTPEAPGRVVTLISRSYWEQLTDHHDAAPEKVWGVAYRITPDRVAEVKEYLDIREVNGYTIHYTPFHPAPGLDQAQLPRHGPFSTLVYIGTPDNDQFVGPQDPQELAEHLYRSEGPSGLNRDYLLGLEQALNELSPDSGDEHVTDLSNRVRAIAAREEEEAKKARGDKSSSSSSTEPDAENLSSPPPFHVSQEEVLQREKQHHAQHHDFRNVHSVDEQEETEKAS